MYQQFKASIWATSLKGTFKGVDAGIWQKFFHIKSPIYLQKIESMDHFKQELIDYLDYYNNCRSKTKLKGLPPVIHRQQALSAT